MTGLDDRAERLRALLGTALIHALISAFLWWGLGAPLPRAVESPIKLFDVAPPPPPETVVVPPPRVASETPAERFSPGEEGAASPPNLRSEATDVAAPEPVVPLKLPPPVVVAPVAGRDADPSSGAADVRGPGTGAGGLGDGRGRGLGGGGGGGGGFGRMHPPVRIRGSLGDSDYPAGLGELGVGGTVSVRYTVTVDGRVVNCRITRSSGNPVLDATTCRLIERRFRFIPSRDEDGRPVRSDIVENHSWIVEDLPPEPPPGEWDRR